jgi:hypothetical protein
MSISTSNWWKEVQMKAVLCMALISTITALGGCGSDNESQFAEDGDSAVGTASQALTWRFESIERNDSGSQQTAYYMYTIDVSGTVCGGANDYIVHFNRTGAYANNSWGLAASSAGARGFTSDPTIWDDFIDR